MLGIDDPDQIVRDPQVGGIFENLVVLEALKSRYNRARTPSLSFFRDGRGNELDLLLDSGRALTGVEIKSSATYHSPSRRGSAGSTTRWPPWIVRASSTTADPHAFSDGIEALPIRRAHELFDGSR